MHRGLPYDEGLLERAVDAIAEEMLQETTRVRDEAKVRRKALIIEINSLKKEIGNTPKVIRYNEMQVDKTGAKEIRRGWSKIEKISILSPLHHLKVLETRNSSVKVPSSLIV